MKVKQICSFVASDETGNVLYIVLDKFMVHLAFQESGKGQLLSKHYVASYLKNTYSSFFRANSVSGRRLQKIASVIDKYCAK